MEKLKIEGMINHAGDEIQIPMEDLDEEDFESMRTVWKETAGAA
jgi:hypothetical protein